MTAKEKLKAIKTGIKTAIGQDKTFKSSYQAGYIDATLSTLQLAISIIEQEEKQERGNCYG